MGNGITWSKKESDSLVKLRGDGVAFERCPDLLFKQHGTIRTVLACKNRARQMGITELRGELWSREHEEILTALVADGASSREIAKDFVERGVTYSRGAICGKIDRMGLQRPVRVKPPSSSRTRSLRAKTSDAGALAHKVISAAKREGKPNLHLEIDDRRPLRCVEINALHLDLLDPALTTDRCHWPYGGWPESTPITFCGHPKLVGSYCLAHYQLSVGNGTPSERAAHKVSRRQAA